MNRTVSPLLHDYKPASYSKTKKSRPLQWFAVGLGIPLLGLALVLWVKNEANDYPDRNVAAQSTTGAELHAVGAHIAAPALELLTDDHVPAGSDHEFHPPLYPAPVSYDSIHLTVRSGDTLDRLFRKNQLDLGDLAQITKLPEAGPRLRMLRPGDELEIRHENGKLVGLYRKLDLTSALVVNRHDEGFAAEIVDRPIELQRRRAYGRINSSLFESANAAGLSDKLIMNLAGIFAWDVDFVLDIRSGDDYYILYEEIYQDGKYVMDGDIIAAEFNNNGRTFQAIRFADKSGRSDYYTPEGRSVRKAFVRAPVDFSRISSSFNPRRRHPVLNTIRAHKGVDYAAPAGTPIKAAGDGKVVFRGINGGYGNAVILQHGGNITTLYAHMSRFSGNAKIGQRVRQGDVIGYVGSTGLATAAHLHYEYRLNGVHRNPRTVELPQADPIKEEYRDEFLAAVEPILDDLLQYKSTQIASAAL
ncbi:MAG TPA: peptidoglycan DD-metalloendopeptidase family protein [Woeseiaceae bacterium]|nr:peptidoglycan DD-metalloendopeptidase family protein [Woeseiaceae bacterium]